jgi:uncharacterized membrane protein
MPALSANATRRLTLTLALGGLLVTLYLAAADAWRGEVPLACPAGSLANCDVVTSSPQSRVGAVPIAFLGVAWFAGLLLLLGLEERLGPTRWLPLAWAAAGLLMVFYLVYAELFLIGAICLWCTVVHGLVIALFLLVLSRFTTPTAAPLTR